MANSYCGRAIPARSRGAMNLKIQTSLSLFFLAIIVLSLPVFLILTLRITTQMIDQQVRYQLTSEAARSVELIQLILKPTESVLSRLSENSFLQEFLRVREQMQDASLSGVEQLQLEEALELNRRGVEDEFRRLLQLNPEYRQVVYLDRSGSVLIEVSREGEPFRDSVDALLAQTIDNERGEVELEQRLVRENRVVPEGVLRYAVPVIRDENVGVEDEALRPALALLGAPVHQQEGVLLLDYRFSMLRDKLISTPVIGTEKGAFFLIDADKRLLAVRDRYRPLLHQFLSQWQVRQPGDSLTYDYTWRENRYLICLWPYSKMGWQLGVVAPQSDFTQYLEQASRTLVLVSIVLFSVALLVALVFIRRISTPLRRFVALAREIAEGNFGVRVTPRGGQEVALLASAFNHMAGRLETYVAEVRKKEQLDQELKIAHTIQAGLLPKRVPQVPGIALGARTVPAREVSGDYYDFLTNGQGTLGLAIGDVTGRGVPAALLMTMIRSVLRSQAQEGPPAEVLRKINNLIHEDVRDSRHSVAMFYGVLDPGRRLFQFTNAGQVFPLWYRRSLGRWQYMELTGLPLGIRRDVAYLSAEVQLEPGDRIVFYTDGLVESVSRSGEMFGFERFEQLLEETRPLPPAQAISEILQRLRAYSGQDDPEDDLTIAVLDVLESTP